MIEFNWRAYDATPKELYVSFAHSGKFEQNNSMVKGRERLIHWANLVPM